jgi:hypothetical protein
MRPAGSQRSEQARTLRRMAWITGVLTVLVGADGLYMQLNRYHPDDVNNFHLSDGATVLIAAALLLLLTVLLVILARSRTGGDAPEGDNGR